MIVVETGAGAFGWNVVLSSWRGSQEVADCGKGFGVQCQAIGWLQ